MSLRALHIALARLKQLRLIDYDQFILDPHTPGKFYLKNQQADNCLTTFLVLKYLNSPIPNFAWQSYPLLQCSASFSYQARIPERLQRELYYATMPNSLRQIYQGTAPRWTVTFPSNPRPT